MLIRQASTGVIYNFYGELTSDGKELLIKDCTMPEKDVTDTLQDIRLFISTDFTSTLYEADLIAYLYQNRIDREWFRITADMVGKKEGDNIPDGMYTISLRVNSTYTTTHTFVVYREIKTAVDAKLAEVGFKVDVRNNSYEYQNSTKYNFEQYSILYSLMSSIENNAYDGDVTATKAAFTQIKKYLKLI